VLIVLRSVATYLVAGALAIRAAHRFVAPVRLRIALLLLAAPLLFTGPALLTGRVYAPADILYNAPPFGSKRAELGVSADRTPLLADVAYQMLPWAAAARRDLSRGAPPLWNPYTLAGEPLLAVQQHGALHPIALLALALPFPQGVTLAMTLRIFAALLAAYLFLREIWCGEAAALLGAVAWAFCDWMAFYLGYPEHPAAAALPLLLLGLRRVAREPGVRAGAIAIAAFLAAALSGHPETLLHVSAAGGAYFAFELARADARRRMRAVLVAALSAAAAAGIAAAVLLPFLEILPQTFEHAFRRDWYAHRPRSLPAAGLPGRLALHAVPILRGASGHGALASEAALPSAYAGALVLPLAFTGLFGRRRERWFFLAAGLAAAAVAAQTPAADLLAKLPLFDVAINERLVFVAAFSLCALAALGADRLSSGEGTPAFVAGSAASLFGVAMLWSRNGARWTELLTPPAFVRERLLLEIVPLALGALLVAVLPRRLRATAAVWVLSALLVAARTAEQARTYPAIDAAAFYPRFEILERIPRGQPYRIAGIGNALVPNTSAVYGLEDVRGYEAMTLRRLIETYPLWCVGQPVWFNRIDDPSRPFLSFLNVRWLLTEGDARPPEDWRRVAEGDGLRLWENPRPLPRAFAPRRILRTPDPARALAELAAVSDFGERGVVEDAAASDWAENGRASVSVSSQAPAALELDVDAESDAVVGTSVTAWPGWLAYDAASGRRLPLSIYNHAFLGLRVPRGRTRVRLRYAPHSFRIGAAVSLLTLASCCVLLWRSRRSADETIPAQRCSSCCGPSSSTSGPRPSSSPPLTDGSCACGSSPPSSSPPPLSSSPERRS